MADVFQPLPGVHVLIVDDNADARDVLSHTLEYCGALVTAVSSAEPAMRAMSLIQPNVIVCDLAMPDVDGYTLMRRIRGLPLERGGDIPAIAVTAYSEAYDTGKAYAAGFDMYMTKPINLTSFCQLVADLASGARPRRARKPPRLAGPHGTP